MLLIFLLWFSFAVLAITEQPLPMVITKGKPLEEPVVVKLLTGASVNIQSISGVKVSLLMDNIPQVKGTGTSSTKNIESEVEKMDDFQHTAKFHLKFLNGMYWACDRGLGNQA